MNFKATLLSVFSFVSLLAVSQTVTIPASNAVGTGAGNSLKRKPLGSYYGYERSAFIYTSTELGITDTSTIQSIAFFVDSVNSFTATNTPVKVYAKETASSAFTLSGTVANELSGATLVYNDTLHNTNFVDNAWTTITFSNSFIYNPANNLEIIIETNAGGTGNENQLSKGFRYNTASAKRFQYWQQDNSAPNGTGTLDTLRPNITINYSTASLCSGTPTPGTIQVSDTAVCSGSTVDLVLQGNSSGSGIQYLWQYSTDSINWTNVNGHQSNYTAQINATTYFKCIVICFFSTAETPVVKVNTLLPVYCYCSDNIGGGCNGYSIDSVSINSTSFNVSVTGCENNASVHYSQYPAFGNYTTTLTAGQTYTITVRETGSNITSLWIDYDHNGVFDHNEWTQVNTSSVTNALYNASFSVPANAYNGLTGMRLRTRASGVLNDSTTACTNFASGETEDFLISIAGGLTIGLKNESEAKNVTLFPNPSNGSFTIETGNSNLYELSVSNILGNTVLESEQKAENGKLRIQLNVAPGIYFIKGINASNKTTFTKRFIIE
ncbi:MAG TPA: GEVED domain-containing protein [Bacteroidia bacterium]